MITYLLMACNKLHLCFNWSLSVTTINGTQRWDRPRFQRRWFIRYTQIWKIISKLNIIPWLLTVQAKIKVKRRAFCIKALMLDGPNLDVSMSELRPTISNPFPFFTKGNYSRTIDSISKTLGNQKSSQCQLGGSHNRETESGMKCGGTI